MRRGISEYSLGVCLHFLSNFASIINMCRNKQLALLKLQVVERRGYQRGQSIFERKEKNCY